MVRQNHSRQESSSTLVMEDVGATSDSTSGSDHHALGDSKPIPFLRRLRDMLVENEDSISFVPGRRARTGESLSLGRIIVHDRIKVEANVLPKYFNHSSFASLRRQLNYFKFVRLGKGRQLESTYINDCVVELDDVLTLKRRSTSLLVEQQLTAAKTQKRINKTASVTTGNSKKGTTTATSIPFKSSTTEKERPLVHSHTDSDEPTRSFGTEAAKPLESISGPETVEEGDSDESKQIDYHDQQELLAGCQALLGLSGREWNPHA
ncbi:hypothetical protein ACA910_019089 [Epithemia clementina (nom. ined.)]